MQIVKLFIDGQATTSSHEKIFERKNPIDDNVVTKASAASLEDVKKALFSAKQAFKSWSQSLPAQRRAILLKTAEIIKSKEKEFTEAMMAETGASPAWAGFNIMLAVAIFQEAAAIVTQIEGEVIPSNTSGHLAMGLRQAAGVVVGIAPWNAPIILGARAIAVPIACGNSVVFKGSETCPFTHALIVECLHEAGLPKGVINYLVNAPEDAASVVESLVTNPDVRRVNFTGSTKIGRIIGALCAKNFIPAVLELGGKSPLLVLDDAEIEEAVNAAVFGSFMNSGQICMSTERIIVDKSIADIFIKALVAKTEKLTVGDPRSENVILGPVYDMATINHCNYLIDDAVGKGARILCGGKASSTIMAATLLDNVTPDMQIYYEETFGPVKIIIRATDESNAIQIANDSEYGLSAAVFTKNISRGLKVANQIQSGICHINSPTVDDEPQMPFGGVKSSGIGRFGGKAGIAEFTDIRWVTIRTTKKTLSFLNKYLE